MRIGIDLGGTKIEGVALFDDGSESDRIRMATPKGDYGATLSAIATIVDQLDSSSTRSAVVGLGHPGSRCPRTGQHRNANSTCLNGRSLVEDLSKLIRRPLRAANDANCFALSEACDGSGAIVGARTVFGVILGTGVGGGVVVDQRVVEGANGVAGEWGHIPLGIASGAERAARPCYCGLSGCLETFCSGPAVAKEFASLTGDSIALEAIATRAASGDFHAVAAMDRFVDRLSSAMASVVQILDPDVIVLGGGVSQWSGLPERLSESIASRVFGKSFRTPILLPKHKDSSGVRGAAWLWTVAESIGSHE
ncbi:MAG: ROK family protein [Planctomycetota bacterium]|nr:ROK family protein [Planctomycetota bacterium]